MRTFLAMLFLSLSPWGLAVGLSPGLIGAYSVPKAISGGGGGGGPTFKGVVEGSSGFISGTWNLTGTLNLAAGDFVVVGVGANVDATAVTVGGQACTKVNSETASSYSVATWYLTNASANASATVTIEADGGNFAVGAAANYSGVVLYSPVDQSSCNSSGCNTIGNAPTDKTAQNVTTTVANTLLVFWMVDDANHTSHAGANGFTVRTASGTKNWALADKAVTSTGTYPSGAVVTTNDDPSDDDYWSLFVAFKGQ